VQCSWEGDNTIMMLQSGRFLINCFKEAKKGIAQPPVVGYLNLLKKLDGLHSTVSQPSCLAKVDNLIEILDIVCAKLVNAAGEQFETIIAKGVEPDIAYEESGN